MVVFVVLLFLRGWQALLMRTCCSEGGGEGNVVVPTACVCRFATLDGAADAVQQFFP